MKHHTILVGAILLALASTAPAQEGYLYYVGGNVDTGTHDPVLDGTPTNDGGILGTLVADVAVTSSTVSVKNWRFANTASQLVPEDNPNTVGDVEAYSWLYTEDAVFFHDGYLYIGPGDWNADATRDTPDAVAYIAVNTVENTGGALSGVWNVTPPFGGTPAGQAINGAEFVEFGGNAYYYVLGGTNALSDRVIYAPVNDGGSGGGLGTFQTTTALPAGDWFNRAVSVDDTLVITDGNGGAANSASHYTTVNSNGTLGTWTSIGPWRDPDTNGWANAVVNLTSANGNEYVVSIGGNGPSNQVRVSQVVAGVPQAWVTNANPLPIAKRQHTAVGINDVVIVLGGSDSSGGAVKTAAVQVGRIDNSGVITWVTTDNDDLDPNADLDPLPRAVAFGGAAFAEATTAPPPPAAAQQWNVYE